jgi:hypothetical protein
VDPEHIRHYVGDMDSKDGPIRQVLYPEEWEQEAEGEDA